MRKDSTKKGLKEFDTHKPQESSTVVVLFTLGTPA